MTRNQNEAPLKDLQALSDSRASTFIWQGVVERADSPTKKAFSQELHAAVAMVGFVMGHPDLRTKLEELVCEAWRRQKA